MHSKQRRSPIRRRIVPHRLLSQLGSAAGAVLLLLALLSPAGHARTLPQADSFKQIEYDRHLKLNEFLQQHDYSWSTLDRGVPRFILTSMPKDMAQVPAVSDKKRIFFLSLLPMVLMANNEILAERRRLKELQRSGASRQREVEAGEIVWLRKLARKYDITQDPYGNPEVMAELLERVDKIPASLVLAQAANESGWGTSRFTRLANNIFGEWTFTPGTGIKPLDRPEGATYEVRRFDSLLASIRSYLNNLNTHWAYRELRDKRAELRHAGLPVRGVDLARHLDRYSTRRDAYVQEILTLIRRNNLTRLADVDLRRPETPEEPTGYGLFSSARHSGRAELSASQFQRKPTTD